MADAMPADALRDRTLLITGASGIVGWGLAHAAIAAGARLVLPSRSAQGVEALQREFGGTAVLATRYDVTSSANLERLRETVLSTFGRLDHVIAPMGGWWQKGPTLTQDVGELSALLSTYVEAQLRLLQAMAEPLRAAGGSYTLVSGAAGERHVRRAGLLVVAVRAQYALSSVLRRELDEDTLRFNEVRVACRIERETRAGAVPAKLAGAHLLEALRAGYRGCLLRYDGRSLGVDAEA
ncbi:MAG: SDR family oxidoreductase [Sandaracinaceae bacterium]